MVESVNVAQLATTFPSSAPIDDDCEAEPQVNEHGSTVYTHAAGRLDWPQAHPSTGANTAMSRNDFATSGNRNVHPLDIVGPDPASRSSTRTTLSQAVGFFPHAKDSNLQDCTFLEVHGDYVVNYGLVPGSVHANSSFAIDVFYKLCPPSTSLFTGRQNMLNDMEAYFSNADGTRRVCVLHGLGGVGKSQLAYRFVENSAKKSRFSDVFFVDASTIDTLNMDLVSIALAKKVGSSPENALRWLAHQRREWLIVLNNADDVELNLSFFFPTCSHGNILITTRNPQLRLYAPPNARFEVKDLEPKEAIALLVAMATPNQSATEATRKQAAAIVKELGCHPLALVQVGAYLEKTQNLDGYLELYRTNQAQLWQAQPVQKHDDYKRTVYTTWQMSVNRLRPEAVTFLRICSFLHHEGISEKIFKAAAAAIPSSDIPEVPPYLVDFINHFVAHGIWRPSLYREMISDVCAYSLVNLDDANDVLSVHPLVHAWLRSTADGDPSIRNCARYLVALSIPKLDDLEGGRLRRALQPHVDALLGHEDKIQSPFLLQEFASLYLQNHRLDEAEKLLVPLVEDNKRAVGKDHPATLLSITTLAATYLSRSQLDAAEELLVPVVEANKQVLGEDHPNTLLSIMYLASTRIFQSQLDAAEELLVPMVEASKRVLGKNHPQTLLSITNLAQTYQTRSSLDSAKQLLVPTVETNKRVLGKDHPTTLLSIAVLAATYHQQGRFDPAEKLLVPVVEAFKRVHGKDNRNTLIVMTTLAANYLEQGRYRKAKRLQVTVVKEASRVLGMTHEVTVSGMTLLMNIRQWREHYEFYTKLVGSHRHTQELEVYAASILNGLPGNDFTNTLHYKTQLSTILLFYFWRRWGGPALRAMVILAAGSCLGQVYLAALP